MSTDDTRDNGFGEGIWLEERLVRDCGMEWERSEALPLDQIELTMSGQTARAEATVDPDRVAIYEAAYRNGARFPAAVVMRARGSRKFRILSGYHRGHGAAGAGLDSIPAIIVSNPSEAQVAHLLAKANATIGFGGSMDDRVHHAFNLHHVHGLSLAEAARTAGAPLFRVENRLKLQRVESRLRRLSVPMPKTPSAVARLDTVKNDRIVAALAGVADRFKTRDFSQLATKASSAPSEDQAIKLIVDEVQQQERQRRRERGNLPGGRAGGAIAKLSVVARGMRGLPTEVEMRAIPDSLRGKARAYLEDYLEQIRKRLEWIG